MGLLEYLALALIGSGVLNLLLLRSRARWRRLAMREATRFHPDADSWDGVPYSQEL